MKVVKKSTEMGRDRAPHVIRRRRGRVSQINLSIYIYIYVLCARVRLLFDIFFILDRDFSRNNISIIKKIKKIHTPPNVLNARLHRVVVERDRNGT